MSKRTVEVADKPSLLTFPVPEVFDPEKTLVSTWARKAKNYLSAYPGAPEEQKANWVYDRLSTQVQFWFSCEHLSGDSSRLAETAAADIIAKVEKQYSTLDLYAVRDSLYSIRYEEVSDFLPSFLERAISSPLSQDELVYIFTARLPKNYSVELRKSPPTSVFEAVKLVRRIIEANSAGRPSMSFSKPGHSSDRGRSSDRGHGQLNSLHVPGEELFHVNVSIANEQVTAALDSGATDSFISWNLARRLALKYTLKGQDVSLADGLTVSSKGYTDVPLTVLGGPTIRVRLWLLGDTNADVILGLSWLKLAKPKIDWTNKSLSWDE